MHEEIRKHASFFICFLIWLFSAVNEIYWLKLDKFPLIWDMSGHFVTSILLFRTLREGIFAAPHIFFINNYYPPLVPLWPRLSMHYLIFLQILVLQELTYLSWPF